MMVDHRWEVRLCLVLCVAIGMAVCEESVAQSETAGQLIAGILANRLSGFRGRARLVRHDGRTGNEETKRLIVKARRDADTSRILYQVVSPAREAGQAVLIESDAGHPARGLLIESPDKITTLASRAMGRPLFGSDLRIEDLTDDFLRWPGQEIVGNESVLGCLCRILESRPAAEEGSSYLVVRSWICPRMALPLRVERVERDGRRARTLVVQRTAKADRDHWMARSLLVTLPGDSSRTLFEGTSFDRDAVVPAAEFEIKAICAAFKQAREPGSPSKKPPEP